MSQDAIVSVRMKKGGAALVHRAIENATRAVFEGPILKAAKEKSPHDTGENAEGIEVDVHTADDGNVVAAIYSTSGYGGYLELGHKIKNSQNNTVVEGRPYIYPAVMENIGLLRASTRRNIEEEAGTF